MAKVIFFLCGRHLYGTQPYHRIEHRDAPPYEVGYCYICMSVLNQFDDDGCTGGFVTETEAEAAYETWLGVCASSDSKTFAEALAIIAEQNMDADGDGGYWHTEETVDALEKACLLRDSYLRGQILSSRGG